MKQKSQRVAPTGAPMNHKNKTDSKPGKTLGNMVGTFESLTGYSRNNVNIK